MTYTFHDNMRCFLPTFRAQIDASDICTKLREPGSIEKNITHFPPSLSQTRQDSDITCAWSTHTGITRTNTNRPLFKAQRLQVYGLEENCLLSVTWAWYTTIPESNHIIAVKTDNSIYLTYPPNPAATLREHHNMIISQNNSAQHCTPFPVSTALKTLYARRYTLRQNKKKHQKNNRCDGMDYILIIHICNIKWTMSAM